MKKISVVIPCFNEEENIRRIPDELLPVLYGLGEDFEVIIVDDGSRDNSIKEILGINDHHIKLIKHPRNLGLGSAIRTAIDNATGDLLVTLDADFTFSPKFIPLLLENMKKSQGIDFVIGSPALQGYEKDIGFLRIIASKLANKIYSFLLGKKATAITPIFRLYKTEQLKSLSLQSKGFEIVAEILFKMVFSGRKFIEVPVTLTKRIYGVSHLNYKKEIIRHFFLVLKIIKWKIFGLTKH
ncbi:MAG: glycosyltransferase family 2 protein [bacterium]|nr:glycosyltransferase family 2 protein [bacterium]